MRCPGIESRHRGMVLLGLRLVQNMGVKSEIERRSIASAMRSVNT